MSVLSDTISSMRSMIVAQSDIVSRLGVWNGIPSVHTRSPLPDDSEFPLILVWPTEVGQNDNSLNSDRILVVSNLYCYGHNPEHYRVVEEISHLLVDLFHRTEKLIIAGYSTVAVIVQGQSIAPSEDSRICGRMVSLSIRLLKA